MSVKKQGKPATSKPAPKAVIVSHREIDGVKFHVEGSEFITILRKRVKEHLAKAKDAESSMVEADAAMTTARAAAEKAWSSVHSPAPRGVGAKRMAAVASYESTRNYGGSIEDPVEALRQAVIFHRNRASALAFYADHLLSHVTYVLGVHDISAYELLEAVSDDSELG